MNDEKFTKIKVPIVRVGKRVNGTYITEEAVEKIRSSLEGTPIVRKTNEYRGCNIDDVMVEELNPIGMVTGRTYYETEIENGDEVKCLIGEGFLWSGKYPKYQNIQSMEITMEGMVTK